MALKLSAEIALVKDDKSLLESHTTLIQQNADSITHKVSQIDFNGVTIASLINQTADTVKINANHIVLEGLITANDYFKINLDGSMESIAGKIGGFNVAATKLFTTGVGLSIAQENQYVIWAGETNGANGYLNTDATFLVESNGKVTAGNLNAYGGTIGGWTINGNSLSSGNMTLNSALGRLYVGSGAYLFNYGGTSVIGLNGSINIQGMIYAPSITLNGHVISIDSNGYLKAL